MRCWCSVLLVDHSGAGKAERPLGGPSGRSEYCSSVFERKAQGEDSFGRQALCEMGVAIQLVALWLAVLPCHPHGYIAKPPKETRARREAAGPLWPATW